MTEEDKLEWAIQLANELLWYSFSSEVYEDERLEDASEDDLLDIYEIITKGLKVVSKDD